MQLRRLGEQSGFVDVDVEEVGGDLEGIAGESGRHGLPLGGGVDGLPVDGIADANGHGEGGFVGLPAIADGVGGVVDG